MNVNRRVRTEPTQMNQVMIRQLFIDEVCGNLRTLMVLEEITDSDACELIRVPVKRLDTATCRVSLKPQKSEGVK